MFQKSCKECGKVNGYFTKKCSQCGIGLPNWKGLIIATGATTGILITIKILLITTDVAKLIDSTSKKPTIDACSKVINVMQEKKHAFTQEEADILAKCVSE